MYHFAVSDCTFSTDKSANSFMEVPHVLIMFRNYHFFNLKFVFVENLIHEHFIDGLTSSCFLPSALSVPAPLLSNA